MAQSLATKALPPLASALPQARRFRRTATKSRQLHDWLADLARQLRGNQARPFYSMTDVAAGCGVAVSTVARVFQELEREGLVLRQRGVMTVLCPRRATPRTRLRGVVAVPIYTPGFLIDHDVRVFHRQLEDRVRRRHFVVDQIFFSQGEEIQPAFVERVLDHHPDCLIWMNPAPTDRETIASIRQAGVRIAIIGHGTSFVDARYQLVDERVLRRALTAWRHAGIRSVIVPGRDTGRITGVVRHTLDELGLRWWFTNPPHNRYTDDLEGIARPAVGVFFADSPWCAQQCSAQPEAVARLIRRVRTLVTNSINLPPPYVSNLRVDAVLFDWPRLAERIAHELGTEKIFTRLGPVTVEPEWHPRLPATSLTVHVGFD